MKYLQNVPKQKNSILDLLFPLLGLEEEKLIKAHGVSKEQYLLWVYQRILRQTLLSAYIITILIAAGLGIAVFFSLKDYSMENDWLLQIFAYLFLGPGLAFFIGWLAIRSLTGKDSSPSNIACQFFINGVARWCTVSMITAVSPQKWEKIRIFQPDKIKYSLEKSLFKSPPKLSKEILQKASVLMRWQKWIGFLCGFSFIALVFSPDMFKNFFTGLFVLSLGAFFFLEGVEGWLTNRMKNTDGEFFYGKSVKVSSVLLLFLGLFFALIGILGFFID